MPVNLSPLGGVASQFFDNNGVILSGGKIYTYAAGTTTPQATYTSSSGATPHANPIILDSAGRVPSGEIWLTDSLIYKFVIETSCASLVVLAADAELINEPLTTPISVNCVNTDELNVLMLVIETSCESFVVLAAEAELINEPLTTPISVNLSFALAVNAFNAVVDVFEEVYEFKAAIETLAADAEEINEPVIVAKSLF